MHQRMKRLGLAAVALAIVFVLLRGRTIEHMAFIGTYHWEMPGNPRLGGLSALEVSADGQSFLALSDRPAFFRGHFVRAAKGGAIIGIERVSMVRPVSDRQRYLDELNGDSEGLAMLPDGRFYMSLEGHHALNLFLPDDPEARWVDAPAHFFDPMPPNKGMEALALDGQGRPIAIPEGWDDYTVPIPVLRLEGDGTWSIPYTLPRHGLYRPVGADLGPDGRLYLLERRYFPLLGFSSRLRSFSLGPDGASDERLLLRSRFGQFDNLEGVSLWQDAAGAIRITMVSDDNFRMVQQTQFVEYRLGR